MKKYTRWMFDITLLVMIGLGFIWPQSLAMNIIFAWAWFGVSVSLLLIASGLVSQALWLKDGRTGFAEITIRALGLNRTLTLGKHLHFIMVIVLITACLLNAGSITTAIFYLTALLGFRFIRSALLMLSGIKPCPEPSA